MNEQKPKSTGLIILIVCLAVIAIIGISMAAYFWGKSKSGSKPSATASPTKTAVSTPTPAKTTTTSPATTEESAKQVAENFMKCTLGTLPGAQINYDKAREYLSDTMKAQYSGDGWVPRFYGIQDGPNDYKFISENETEDGVVLRYDAYWGNEVGLGWTFTMAKDNNKWYINGFRNDAQ